MKQNMNPSSLFAKIARFFTGGKCQGDACRLDKVEEASDDSFPASDPPAWTKTSNKTHN